MILLLLACGRPPIADPVEQQLALEVLERGEVALRIFVAISGIIAESCGVPITDTYTIADYTFVGGAAVAMGVSKADLSANASDQEWTFDTAGLEDVGEGQLKLTTTADRSSFEIVYFTNTDIVVAGTIPVIECDVVDSDATEGVLLTGEAATGGQIEYTRDNVTTRVLAEGEKPFAGLHFSPPNAATPTAGWAHWSDEGSTDENGDELILDGAADIDLDGGVWPAVAMGLVSNSTAQTQDDEWDRAVEVALP